MTSFEEEFPNLVQWVYNPMKEPVVRSKAVEDFCLDKQKVKEAIEQLMMGDYNPGLLPDEEGYKENPNQLIDGEELLRELGL